MTTIAKMAIAFSLICCATGCYRMPDHDEFSLVPSTNNPTYTREKASPMPGVGY